MLLRLQSVDSNHCQRDHLGKQRETWASNAPNLNRFVCSKQCAPAEVWVGCHQRRFCEECDWVSPCYEQGPDFHPTSRAVRWAFIFFCVCACVRMWRFCLESYCPFDSVLKVTRHVRPEMWGFCWILSEKQSLLLSFLHWYLHTFWQIVCFRPNYVDLFTPSSYSKNPNFRDMEMQVDNEVLDIS